MRHRHQVSVTTHTVEMAQIAEINNGLRERESAHAIRASLLGMQGVKLSPGNDDNDDNTLPRSSPLQNCLVDPDLIAVLGDKQRTSRSLSGPRLRAIVRTQARHGRCRWSLELPVAAVARRAALGRPRARRIPGRPPPRPGRGRSRRTSSALLLLQPAGAPGCPRLDSRSGSRCGARRAAGAAGGVRRDRRSPCPRRR